MRAHLGHGAHFLLGADVMAGDHVVHAKVGSRAVRQVAYHQPVRLAPVLVYDDCGQDGASTSFFRLPI